MTINTSVIVSCAIACALTTIIPMLMSIILLMKKKINIISFFSGFGAFFISQIVLRLPLMKILFETVPTYVKFTSTIVGAIIIGGLSAGLFEETARLICAKLLLKNNRFSFKDGISFGLGHAFCEVLVLVGLNMFFLLIIFILINTDTFKSLINASNITEVQYNEILTQYTSVCAIDFIYAIIERCSSIMFHVMNTLIVFHAVKYKKYGYYVLAILFHTLFNGLILVSSKYCGLLFTEIFLLVLSACGLIFTIKKVKSSI